VRSYGAVQCGCHATELTWCGGMYCSVCNTVKCALAMWLSIPLFHNPVTGLGTLGSVIVVLGVLLYNKARDYERRVRRLSMLHRHSAASDILEI